MKSICTRVAGALFICVLFTVPALAATRTWTGATDSDWTKGSNWGGTAPVSGDTANIPGGLTNYPIITSSVTIATLNINSAGSGAAVTVSSGGTLNVSSALTVNANGTLTVNGGTILSAGVLTVNGNVSLSSGTIHMANALATTPTDNITINVGGVFSQSGGTVAVKDFTTTAGSPAGAYDQSGGTFKIYHDFKNSGTFDATGGTIQFAGTGGGNAFNAPGTNQFFNVVVDSGVTTDFSSNLAASIYVRGDWTVNGTATLTGNATTVIFNGTGAQAIGGASSTTFRNITIDKASGTASLTRSHSVNSGNLLISAGTLDLSSFTMNRTSSGGSLTVSNGATLQIGGTNSFPTNYATHSLGATSTVEYKGTNQTVTAESYGHLTLSGSGTKTMPGTAMTIAGNFTMAGTASATAAQALTVNGNFTLNSGTSFSAASYSHGVKGNFTNSGTFTAGTSVFTFNGTGAQVIGGLNSTTFNSLTINNSSGVSLSGVDVTVGATLTFTSGNITTGSNTVIIPSGGSISRTSGHVAGNLRKYIATGATSATFEIGGPTNYRPVSVSFASVTTAGNLTASSNQSAGDHPNIGSSNINAAKTANRYWTLTNSGIAFTTYSATFNFVAADLDAGANTSNFIVGKYGSGTWSYPTVGTRTGTSTQATGLASFSDFQLGEAGTPNIDLLKTVDPSGTQPPETDLLYSIAFSNSGSGLAQNLVISDPVPNNTDFKVGSVTNNLGTTGLTVVVAYSNNGGGTFVYTPVSGGGSAPAGYDRNVTNVRWTFTGNLSQTSPNNNGSVSFTARIR